MGLRVAHVLRGFLGFLLVVTSASCSKDHDGHIETTSMQGNLGAFILRSIEHLGGDRLASNSIPELHGEWTTRRITGAEYQDGREEIVIEIRGDRFTELTNFLFSYLGKPSIPTRFEQGCLHGLYAAHEFGVAVQFYYKSNETGLIIDGKAR